MNIKDVNGTDKQIKMSKKTTNIIQEANEEVNGHKNSIRKEKAR